MRVCGSGLTLVLALSTVAFGKAAAAQDWVAFRSPSGNIRCVLVGGAEAYVRCDIYEATRSFRKRPPDCEFDWGMAFGLEPSGPGTPLCVSDAVGSQEGMVLGYGEAVALGGIACRSERTGMLCTNGTGGGFHLARAAQRVF